MLKLLGCIVARSTTAVTWTTPVKFATIVLIGLGIALFMGRGPVFPYNLREFDDTNGIPALMAGIEKLPKGSLLAGWPEGAMDRVPLVANKRVLLARTFHWSYYHGYTIEMRRRADAVFDAYFATTLEPLRKLHDEFGVTHLLIDRRNFDQEPPHYFAPFDEQNRLRFSQMKKSAGGPIVLSASQNCYAINEGPYAVLDLDCVLHDQRTTIGPATN
jgi:hypothetical protein